MLACIACSKGESNRDDTGPARGETPSIKDKDKHKDKDRDAVKSLTSQIKDMVLKLSGLQCKGGGGSSSSYRSRRYHSHHRRRRRSSAYNYRDACEDDDDDDEDIAISSMSDQELERSHYGAGSYSGAATSSLARTAAWDFATTVSRSEAEGRKAKWRMPGSSSSRAKEINGNDDDVNLVNVVEQNGVEPKEWTALVEPGVQITFVSIPGGVGNDLKRIRFSREMYNKWEAQRWWGENLERIMELYNVQSFSRQSSLALTQPSCPVSDDHIGLERESFFHRVGSTRERPATPPSYNNHIYRPSSTSSTTTSGGGGGGGGDGSDSYYPSVPDPTEHILPHYLFHNGVGVTSAGLSSSSLMTGLRVENSSSSSSCLMDASGSMSNASQVEMSNEWVEHDEPGVYMTIRQLTDGTRELRQVRFSREKFGEVHAKLWWEDNRERILAQYL